MKYQIYTLKKFELYTNGIKEIKSNFNDIKNLSFYNNMPLKEKFKKKKHHNIKLKSEPQSKFNVNIKFIWYESYSCKMQTKEHKLIL